MTALALYPAQIHRLWVISHTTSRHHDFLVLVEYCERRNLKPLLDSTLFYAADEVASTTKKE